MCGIVGLIGDLPPADAGDRVRRAVNSLRHRGPDGEGLFLQPPGDARAVLRTASGPRQLAGIGCASNAHGIVLGHRRLAILDLTPAASQPMVSADERHVIVFNGEIYNYLELRAALESAGERFQTASDTEVLLSGHRRWGRGVLDRAVGMFAFALLDRAEQTVTLARDCFGMKPLYYARGERGIGFASEPGVLLPLLDLRAEADPEGIADYLAHGITDHRRGTMFAEVLAVPPASTVTVSLRSLGSSEPVRYWTPAADRLDGRPPAAIARDLRERFLRSVELHLRSDVRVGTLLSGGIDSSAIVMAMREVGGSHLEIRTFSFVPDAGAVSEERWIDTVNAAARAVPHKVRVARDRWEVEAGDLAVRQGEPFGTLAVHAQSALYRTAAEQGVRVLLDGQGADEMLAGYTLFRGVRMAGHIRRSEYAAALRLARGIGRDAPSMTRKMVSCLHAFRPLLPPWAEAGARRLRPRSAVADRRWLQARHVDALAEWRPSGERPLQDRLRAAIEVSSLPALLRYADRSAMMHGVESRLPFLTRDLVELALALPDHLLISDDGLGKAIFRDAMRGLVPDAVLDRREKIGFAVPLRDWLIGSEYARQAAASTADLPCVNPRLVRTWVDDLAAGRAPSISRVFLLWRLIGLGEWVRQYGVNIA